MWQRIKENLYPLSYLLAIPSLYIFYVLLNRDNGDVYSLATDIDRMIPFLPVFVIPYVAWYLFLPLTLIYFCMKDKQLYYKILITYVVSIMACYFVYFVFQTSVASVRPALAGDDIFTKLVGMIYQRDEPYNAFPSIHAFTSYLMMKGIIKSPFRNRGNVSVISSLAVLIMISTIFIKQHVIMDVFAAVILVDVVFKAVDTFSEGVLWERQKRLQSLSIMKKKENVPFFRIK